jgi:photosystem II stability/assembly factor-like uncharacterized protein
LYKSVDRGSSWSDSINPSQSGCSDDTLLAMDPTDPSTLYIRSGDDFDGYGLRKSTDGGATWSYTNLYANYFYAFAIDAAHPSTLYAGTDNGIVRSTDRGVTWSQLGLVNANVNLLATDPAETNILYSVATSDGIPGIFKSTDGGTSWSRINRGLGDIVANPVLFNSLLVDPTQAGVLYLATSGYGVFCSVDGGATWRPLNDGLTNLDVRVLAFTGGSANVVYAGTPGGIFRIADDLPASQIVRHHPAH